MKHYVSVRVVGSDARPVRGTRVTLAGSLGTLEEKTTNSDGEASFTVDVDPHSKLWIYANGQEKVKGETIRSDFRIVI